MDSSRWPQSDIHQFFSQLEKEVSTICIAPILHGKKAGDWNCP